MKKMLCKIFFAIVLVSSPLMCLADNYNNFGLDNENLKTKFGTADVPTLAGNIIKIIIGLSASVMLIMILWSGIELMFSNGKPDVRKAAINRIVWTSVGIIVVISAYAISQFVINQINFLAK